MVCYLEIMWMEWFGLNDGHTLWPLKSLMKSRKTKTPPATGAGGVLEKIDDLNQIVNYLPASLVRELLSKPILGDPVPESRLLRISAMHAYIPGDHWVGWRWLVWIVGRMTC